MEDEKYGEPSPEGPVQAEVQPPEPVRPNDGESYFDDVYSYPAEPSSGLAPIAVPAPAEPPGPPRRPPILGSDDGGDGDDDEGMLRMSFMEHLEELRTRIIRAAMGVGVAFVFSLLYSYKLWDIVREPATEALVHLGVNPPRLAMTQPMESFSIIWVKLPLLCSFFLASPWVLYQVWAFISPGLYKKERRLAVPFILSTAGLFITGGLFAYFLAFRFGLEFLLGLGVSNDVQPVVTITEYFDLFVNVTLGVGLVFELPVLIFFLTLIHMASPRFLLRHSRYAVLAIVIIAAIVTPTPDFFNLMLFAVPMTMLYFVGVFAGYLVVLRREGKAFPWFKTLLIAAAIIAAGAAVYFICVHFGIAVTGQWPFFIKH